MPSLASLHESGGSSTSPRRWWAPPSPYPSRSASLRGRGEERGLPSRKTGGDDCPLPTAHCPLVGSRQERDAPMLLAWCSLGNGPGHRATGFRCLLPSRLRGRGTGRVVLSNCAAAGPQRRAVQRDAIAFGDAIGSPVEGHRGALAKVIEELRPPLRERWVPYLGPPVDGVGIAVSRLVARIRRELYVAAPLVGTTLPVPLP